MNIYFTTIFIDDPVKLKYLSHVFPVFKTGYIMKHAAINLFCLFPNDLKLSNADMYAILPMDDLEEYKARGYIWIRVSIKCDIVS